MVKVNEIMSLTDLDFLLYVTKNFVITVVCTPIWSNYKMHSFHFDSPYRFIYSTYKSPAETANKQ